MEICAECGQVMGVPEYDEKLRDIYSRISDGRSHREALVFDGEWLNEHIIDDDDVEVLKHTMEKDMHERGLCGTCGRPDLRGVDPSEIVSEEAARELADMYAEQAAELRAGC